MHQKSRLGFVTYVRWKDVAMGSAVVGASLLIWPDAAPWVAGLFSISVLTVAAGRYDEARQVAFAKERLAQFGGDQEVAFAAFCSALGETPCDQAEVEYIYKAIQSVASPLSGPMMPLFPNDKLLQIAFDEDDINLDLLKQLHDEMDRDFSEWNDTEDVTKTETVGELIHLMGMFPKKTNP